MARGWPVTLTHDGVTVRPIARRDATTWARLRADNLEWLSPWEATLPDGAGRPPTSYLAMVAGLRRRAREGLVMPFAIVHDRRMVGQLSVNGITGGSAQTASIGYWIARTSAGRSITPTAVALVTDHLLTGAGLHRVEIAIRPENAASLRVVEKLGFHEYGMAPGYLHISGEWRDHRLFQMLAENLPEGGLVNRLHPSF